MILHNLYVTLACLPKCMVSAKDWHQEFVFMVQGSTMQRYPMLAVCVPTLELEAVQLC